MTGHDTIQVQLNGDTRAVARGRTVETLLGDLGLHPRLVVVEYNREILDRARYAATEVREGDMLEVVHFVGGG